MQLIVGILIGIAFIGIGVNSLITGKAPLFHRTNQPPVLRNKDPRSFWITIFVILGVGILFIVNAFTGWVYLGSQG